MLTILSLSGTMAENTGNNEIGSAEIILLNPVQQERRMKIQAEKFGNIIRSVSTGVGMTSLSYLEIRHIEGITPEISFAIRVGIGVTAAAVHFVVEDKAIKYFGGESAKDIFKGKDIKKKVLGLAHEGGKFITFWAFLPAVAANFYDYLQNSTIQDSVSEIQANTELFDASSSQAAVSIVETQIENIISNFDESGNLTQKSMAEMAVFFDGHKLDWNPQLPEIMEEAAQTWELNRNGQNWEVDFYNLDNWVIKGPNLSWWVGSDANGKSVLEEFHEKYPRDLRSNRDISDLLDSSGLVDGKPFKSDLVENINFEHIPLTTDTKPSFLLPLEYGEAWRVETGKRMSTYESFNPNIDASIWENREKLLGVNALNDPNSYASFLNNLKNIK